MSAIDEGQRRLAIIWTSSDPDLALNMVFMYAGNSLLRDWWDRVRIIAWGPSTRLLLSDPAVQAGLNELHHAGVETWACKACAERYGIVAELEALGLDVRYVGEPLSRMLQAGWTSLTF